MPLTQADLVAGPPVTPLSALKLGEPVTPAVPSAREKRPPRRRSPRGPRPSRSQAPTAKPAPAPPAKPIPAESPPRPRGSNHTRNAGSRATTRISRPDAPEHATHSAAGPHREPPRAEPARVVEPARSAPAQTKGSRKGRKSGRSLHLALAGAVLAACAQLLISAASSPRSEIAERFAPRDG